MTPKRDSDEFDGAKTIDESSSAVPIGEPEEQPTEDTPTLLDPLMHPVEPEELPTTPWSAAPAMKAAPAPGPTAATAALALHNEERGGSAASGEVRPHAASTTVDPDPTELSVELDDEVGAAARALAALTDTDEDSTAVVEVPTERPLVHDCRMCGTKISAPRPLRWTLGLSADEGFACDTCGNLFCTAHAVRLTGPIGSLLFGARFRCQLCFHR